MITQETEKELLSKALDEVFGTMMHLEVTHCDSCDDDDIIHKEHLTATIGFAGGWNGFVSIACSITTARLITQLLLGTSGDEIPCDEIRDAVGEVVNMVGGRYKSLFSEHLNSGAEVFKMSIPSVVQGKEYNIFAPANSGSTKIAVKIKDEKLSAFLALSEDKGN